MVLFLVYITERYFERMKKMLKKKKITVLVLSLMMGLTFFVPSATMANLVDSKYSENKPPSKMTQMREASNSLSISSGTAKIYAKTTGIDEVSKVQVEVQLQQYKNNKWTTKGSWSASSNSIQVILTKTYAVEKGYQYRLVSTRKATLNGNTETVVKTGPSVSA